MDYNEVSRQAEKLRLAMTRADAFEIDFEVSGRKATLKLLCDRQEAQKSHGLCRGDKPDVANLPAGEVYFVPTGAEGQFPRRYEDGTLGMMDVAGGRIRQGDVPLGQPGDRRRAQPAAGLGPGDRRTRRTGLRHAGTAALGPRHPGREDPRHAARGHRSQRSPGRAPDARQVQGGEERHARRHPVLAHQDAGDPACPQARMFRDGKVEVVIENYQPAPYLERALAS